MIFFTSIIFIFLNHPLSFGVRLLIQTINISLLSGIIIFNFWYSYIIFLIIIGGILVLFLYMTNVASNEKFQFSLKLNIILYSFIFIIIISLLINYQFYSKFNNLILNFDSNFLFNQTITKFITFPINTIYLIIIIYLFITLIAVVKITNIKYGPLRQIN